MANVEVEKTENGAGSSDAEERPSGKQGKAKADAKAMIELRKITRTYYRGKEKVEVLRNLDLDITEGAFEALMGPSGSGKTTLLNLIAGLDSPTSGSIKVGGVELAGMGEGARA